MDLFQMIEQDRARKEEEKKVEADNEVLAAEAVVASEAVIEDESWFGFEKLYGVDPPRPEGGGFSMDRLLSKVLVPKTEGYGEYKVSDDYLAKYNKLILAKFRKDPVPMNPVGDEQFRVDENLRPVFLEEGEADEGIVRKNAKYAEHGIFPEMSDEQILEVLAAGGQELMLALDEYEHDAMVSDYVNQTYYVPRVLANKQKLAEAEAAGAGVPWYTTVGQVFTDSGTQAQFLAETAFPAARVKSVAGYGWKFAKETGRLVGREAIAAGIFEADRALNLVERGVMTEEEAALTVATTTIGASLIVGAVRGGEAVFGRKYLKGSAKGMMEGFSDTDIDAAVKKIVKDGEAKLNKELEEIYNPGSTPKKQDENVSLDVKHAAEYKESRSILKQIFDGACDLF